MLLETINLTKTFPLKKGIFPHQVAQVKAVDKINLIIESEKTFALVGESGCGKTTAGKCIVRLLDCTSGEIRFQGKEINSLTAKELKPLRKQMQIIFQDPYASLNPRMTVHKIIEEGLIVHQIGENAKERKELVKSNLLRVGLDPVYLNRYPHEFSGGQRQRISIARALAVNPSFIVCDEIVSALDVSVQAQILNLFMDLQKENGLTYLFITHNLAVVEYIADQVAVMYLGQIVEETSCERLFNQPMHPYTIALLDAIPSLDPDCKKNLPVLSGDIPSTINPPPGCSFHTRCPKVMPHCKTEEPPYFNPAPGHKVKCFLAGEKFFSP